MKTIPFKSPLTLCILALLSLALGACREKRVHERNHFRTQTLIDLFDTIHRQERKELIQRKMERAQALYAQSDFFDAYKQHRQKIAEAERLNTFLKKGLLTQGQRLVRIQRQKGATVLLNQASDLFADLIAIREYLEHFPVRDPEAFQAAHERLLNHLEIVPDYDWGQQWLEKQNAFALKLQQHLQRNAQREALYHADRRIAENAAHADLMALHALRASSGVMAPTTRSPSTPVGSPIDMVNILKAVLHYPLLPEEVENAILTNPASTVACLRLQTRLAAYRGELKQTVTNVKMLGEFGIALDTTLTQELLFYAILDPVQLRAKPWRTPFPTVSDALNAFIQIQQNQVAQ
jgi:hypothetical protein